MASPSPIALLQAHTKEYYYVTVYKHKLFKVPFIGAIQRNEFNILHYRESE